MESKERVSIQPGITQPEATLREVQAKLAESEAKLLEANAKLKELEPHVKAAAAATAVPIVPERNK
jgi:t-SNARE complex subunit (syntaxin)